jgi:ketosteroid isomerase-like protein
MVLPTETLRRSAAVAGLALASISTGACASSASSPPARVVPSLDALRASLTQAEIDFAAARGVDAWVDAFGEEGMSIDAAGHVTHGKAAMRAMMAPVLAKVRLTWRPATTEVAPSGEMGFTFGPYEVIERDPQGHDKVVSKGTYMTVWRRQPDGTWKVAADLGSKDTSAP